MKPHSPARRRALAVSLALAALAGCGHGGDSGNGVPPGVSGDGNATGLWQGTVTTADGLNRGFSVIVAPSGEFTGVIASSGTNGRFLLGTVATTLSAFSASGTVFAQAGEALLPDGQLSDALTVSGGTVVTRISLTGDYSGGGESASFSLTYDGGATARGASLTAVAGVYSAYPPTPGGVPSATLAISGDAVTFATDGGCNGAGTIAVIDPTLNIYSWSMLIGPCPGAAAFTVSGLATLTDSPRGGNANLIALYGATAEHDQSFVFRAAK
jgi:hypothetical protein